MKTALEVARVCALLIHKQLNIYLSLLANLYMMCPVRDKNTAQFALDNINGSKMRHL